MDDFWLVLDLEEVVEDATARAQFVESKWITKSEPSRHLISLCHHHRHLRNNHHYQRRLPYPRDSTASITTICCSIASASSSLGLAGAGSSLGRDPLGRHQYNHDDEEWIR